jgi:transcriptional regulator with XRE-family HTH domain
VETAGTDTAALFNRHNLRTARELRGLTQTQLASRVGSVASASISQFEKGHARPSAATLERLAQELEVPITFFAAPIAARNDSDLDGFFRSLRSTAPRDRRQARALVEVVRAVTLALESVAALPPLNLPRFPVMPHTDGDEIEHIA